ncbi:alpha-mannosidase [Pseudoroseicyclus aestuarii]|uniref:Alpha-mannosidase n=1 Tax=Pseudoroseicyclus aestuarii TaxID=1795041 RepID=A0A318SPC4_9RHOB|nr:glycoside hydrolase family 38 C-terminal domain-containing protein [Pseudoroseicyclus aestuarii]PYE82445.1 alpha-mannosidase [Pseudoroseicyclus aestuarii]
MSYSTPLKSKLSLTTDDVKQEGKLDRLLKDLEAKILQPVPGQIDWHVLDTGTDPDPAEALSADWRGWPGFTQRTTWSRAQGHTWFAAEITVPEEAKGQTFVLRFSSQWQERPGSTDPQCLAYLDGKIAQAIDGNHTELLIMRDAVPGTTVTLHVDAFTFFDRPLAGFGVEYLVRNEAVERLYHDLRTPFDVAARLHQTDARRHEIFNRVDRALRALDRRGEGLTPGLEASLAEAGAIAEEIYALQDTEVQPTIAAFGHTHIDIAWLWRVLHTREKGGRSFATALANMVEYPQFKFMYNQAVLYHYLKTDYPDLWAGIKEAVSRGQLEIEGAMWVEPDANIVSGESMVRQILMGRRFHQEEFGVTPTCVWLPDTFGYSANMPQILDKSGLSYFVTSKLSWNDTDRHPFDTFFWRGIDGTDTKAHLLVAQEFESDEIFTTYNSDLSASQVMGAWKRYEPKAASSELAICYGWGDGGGGPTRDMIERATRFERGIPGAPKMKLDGLRPFLDRMGAAMEAEGARFPRWQGELYLQFHRGTLTTIGRTKRNNRLAERLMREMEFMTALAWAQGGADYPEADLDRMWKIVLLNQFHDILPGTSIPEVYEDSEAEYAALFAEIESGNGPLLGAMRALGGDEGARVVNATGHARDGALALLPDGLEAIATGGRTEPVQRLHRADGSSQGAAPVHGVGPMGWAGIARAGQAQAAPSSLSAAPDRLENAQIRATFDAAGEITSVIDKATGRELIPEGQRANRLVAFEDKSVEWDAWDIDWYFEEQSWPFGDSAEIEVIEEGPHRAALKITKRYQGSSLTQIVSLEEGARQIEFDTQVDWQERQTVLKAMFPFDLNVAEVRSEIQFGHVQRATHRNTSWDKARFEASMHRWVDMSEPDFGAALLNDCKYGYSAHDQEIGLTLLRGSTWPHPDADRGIHGFRYALLLHGGAADLEVVHHAAEDFNTPLRVIGTPGETAPAAFSLARMSAPNVAIETVKRSEDGKALVVRLFEHANRRAVGRLDFGLPVASVRRANLMEEEASAPLEVTGGGVDLTLRPFEIVTLLVEVGHG